MRFINALPCSTHSHMLTCILSTIQLLLLMFTRLHTSHTNIFTSVQHPSHLASSAIDDLLVYDSMNTMSSNPTNDDDEEEDYEDLSSLDEQGTIIDIKDMDIWDASFDPGDFFGLDFLRYLREYFDKHATDSGLTFAAFGTWVRHIPSHMHDHALQHTQTSGVHTSTYCFIVLLNLSIPSTTHTHANTSFPFRVNPNTPCPSSTSMLLFPFTLFPFTPRTM